MYFSSSIEVRQVDFSSKAKSRHQFISIVVEDYVANLVKCLFVLAAFDGSDMVQRIGLILDSIACCEVNAHDHSHLHSA